MTRQDQSRWIVCACLIGMVACVVLAGAMQ